LAGALNGEELVLRNAPESDWKAFRELREVALQRFCERVLGEVASIAQDSSRSHHERYLTLFRHMEQCDEQLAYAFNDPARSRMIAQLAALRRLDLVAPHELGRFTQEARSTIESLAEPSKRVHGGPSKPPLEPSGTQVTMGQPRDRSVKTKDLAHQFKVTLRGIEPAVWRRIVVPASYSFWDLHVAIQDSMGWRDYHLHAFRVRNPKSGEAEQIGIPDDDPFEGAEAFLPGWEVPIVDYFGQPGARADYEYDFGDGWKHEVVLEQVTVRVPKAKYPICVDGAGACPPEDCGGIHGYQRMLKVLHDPTHEEHESTVEWVGGHYDPAAFDPKRIRFDSPKKRWRIAFRSADEPRG
jgi:pRiA4b ORF-3-like protein